MTNKLRIRNGKLARTASGRVRMSIAGGAIAPSAATAIALNDVTDGRYYQRVGTSKAVPVTGTYSGYPDAIEGRYVPDGTAIGDLSGTYPWATVAVAPSGGTFSGTITAPQGGWWNLQVRDSVDHNVNAAGVSKFRVGIGIAAIGQSNMVGLCKNESGYRLSSDLVRRWAGNGWKRVGNYTAAYPAGTLYGVYGGGAFDTSAATTTGESSAAGRGDGMIELTNQIAAATGVPVFILPYAVGGTAISQWVPGGAKWNDFITGANQAGGDFELALYYQGEDDAAAATSLASYKNSLGLIRAGLLAQTGRTASTLKFGICTLSGTSGYGGMAAGAFGTIRKAQLEFINEQVANGVFYLGNPIDGVPSDGVHLDGASLVTLGARGARSILKQLGLIANGGEGPYITTATRSTNVITVSVQHRGGSGLVDGAGGAGSGLTAFRVYDNGTPVTISSTAITGGQIVLTLASTPAGTVTLDHTMQDLPFTLAGTKSKCVYDNQVVAGDSLGLPLQPTDGQIAVV